MKEILKFISDQMDILAVPYEFGEWTSDVTYPYFVGEITEDEPTTEDGAETASFILTGFHRGKLIDLEEIKEKIKKHFSPIYGLRARTNSGTIAVFFVGAFFIPSGEAELKKIQINLKIETWKGDL
jgi:hypothetical protein